ncbi:hypothetical protein WA556_006756, partial [Blastocystis sp. ATCC 50177/Nand II]
HTATVPAEAQEQLEQGLTLQGAAAIQDDLVKDVCLSVRRLQATGIRFWILTGDKPDTAEAIALAAGVAEPTTPFLRLTRAQLQRNASQEIASSSPSQLSSVTSSPSHSSTTTSSPSALSSVTPSPSHLSSVTSSPSALSSVTSSPSALSSVTPSPSHLSTVTPSPSALSS